MNRAIVMLAVAGVGAAASYLFDPQLGRRRRALMRDQFVHLARVGSGAFAMTCWSSGSAPSSGLPSGIRARSR
jgi:hypothetical protein